MLARQQSIVASGVQDTLDLPLPFRAQRLESSDVARLPVIKRDIFQFVTGLIEQDCLPAEIKQRSQQSERIGFEAPKQHCDRGIAPLALIHRFILVAGAIQNPVALDE